MFVVLSCLLLDQRHSAGQSMGCSSLTSVCGSDNRTLVGASSLAVVRRARALSRSSFSTGVVWSSTHGLHPCRARPPRCGKGCGTKKAGSHPSHRRVRDTALGRAFLAVLFPRGSSTPSLPCGPSQFGRALACHAPQPCLRANPYLGRSAT